MKEKCRLRWQQHIQAYCHDLWGKGGFTAITADIWDDWYDCETRADLTEWEFAVHVVMPWVAAGAVGPAPDHMAFASSVPTKQRIRESAKQVEYLKRTFARGDQIAKTAKSPDPADPDPEPDVGSLAQPPRPRGKLRVVYGAVGACPAPLTAVTPRAVLLWAEEVTDALADRGEFATITALMGYAWKMAALDGDDATAACRVLAALYREEDEQERREMRGMAAYAMRPPKDAAPPPEPEKPPAPDIQRPRATTKVEVRAGAAGAVTVAEGKKGGKKYRVWGHPVTAILRWMGSDAWTFKDARTALKKLGVPDVGDPTVKAQLLAGRAGGDCNGRGPAAALTPAQTETLYSLLEKTGAPALEQAAEEHGPAHGQGDRPGREERHRPHQNGRQTQAPAVPAEGRRVVCPRCDSSKVWLHPKRTCPIVCWEGYYGCELRGDLPPDECPARPRDKKGKGFPHRWGKEPFDNGHFGCLDCDEAAAVRPPDEPARVRGGAGGADPRPAGRPGGVGETKRGSSGTRPPVVRPRRSPTPARPGGEPTPRTLKKKGKK